jgi:hypothetical protein
MLVQIVSFLQAHQAALSAAGIAILDLAIEINPHLAGNGIVSQLLHFLGLRKLDPPSGS